MAKRGFGLRAVLVAAGVLSACAPPALPTLDVERQWSEAIANLGMFAIYPPTEDVMVGDAFLYLPGATFFDLVRVTSAPLEPLAEQFCYQEIDRMAVDTLAGGKPGVVRAAPVRGGKDPCKDVRHQRIAPHDADVDPTQHATRLREAAMPLLEVGRFTEGELAGAGLLGSFGGALGIGTSGQAAMRLSLRNLQSLSVDELRGSRLLEDISRSRVARLAAPGGRDYPNSLTPLMLARSLRLADQRNGSDLSGRFCRGEFEAINATGARVVVANRVLYAGGVSYEFTSSRVTSVKLALDFASVLAGMPQKPVVPAELGAKAKAKEGEDGGADDEAKKDDPKKDDPKKAEPPPRATLAAQLAGLVARLEGLSTLDAGKAGQVSGRLATGRFGNLALEKEFHRPAAVGMGAALHFPIGEAAVPAGPGQIDEVVAFCRETVGRAEMRLWEQLAANYRWAYFLYRKRDVDVATALADADAKDTELRARARVPARALTAAPGAVAARRGLLPPMRIDPGVRVRP